MAKRPNGSPLNDAKYRVEFGTLHNIDEIQVPRGKWDEADYLEPITKDYPQFGDGGASQIIFYSKTKVNEVFDITTDLKIYPN